MELFKKNKNNSENYKKKERNWDYKENSNILKTFDKKRSIY